MNWSEVARTIESTLLGATVTVAQVESLCREALESGFHGVCVPPCRVPEAAGYVEGSAVRVVSVAGFPLGAQTTAGKVRDVSELFELGAHEVDLVMNLGWFLDGRLTSVSKEIREARRAAGDGVLKVIVETGVLMPGQAREASALALGAGADFLKTSTGFGPTGARIPDVRLLRQVAGSRCGVKAAGGIRTFDQVLGLLAAGADRIGTSAAGAIRKQAREQGSAES